MLRSYQCGINRIYCSLCFYLLCSASLKSVTHFPLCAAIILVAVTYYYSQPVGTGRWMRALLYPFAFSSVNILLILRETTVTFFP